MVKLIKRGVVGGAFPVPWRQWGHKETCHGLWMCQNQRLEFHVGSGSEGSCEDSQMHNQACLATQAMQVCLIAWRHPHVEDLRSFPIVRMDMEMISMECSSHIWVNRATAWLGYRWMTPLTHICVILDSGASSQVLSMECLHAIRQTHIAGMKSGAGGTSRSHPTPIVPSALLDKRPAGSCT